MTYKSISMEKCIKLFDTYLQYERDLSASYRYSCRQIARLFLHFRFADKPICPVLLKPQNITSFVLSYASKSSPRRTQGMVSVLRAFLRFLTLHFGTHDFTGLIPAVAVWSKDQIPSYLSKSEVLKLHNYFDKKTLKGLQDYTIVRLLYSLGLRASEVANLTLDDFHWVTGELSIHGKGSKLSKMPLSQGLGDDLVNYLRQRPSCNTPNFFVSTRLNALNGHSIGKMVSEALKNLGLRRKKGMAAHSLRHSLATHLLQKGASLQQICEVLRHQSIDSTQIYAKVDFKRLRSLAQAWPKSWNPGGSK